jgi:uncharacterized protein YebE (UPF0316 family)
MELPEFLTTPNVWLYVFVFFGKILEVAVSTVRIVLINRGERLKGSIAGFFEISLWLFVTGTVLVGFQKDLLRCLIFAVAFALGNYIGSWVESKLAFGLCSIQVIVNKDETSDELVKALRDKGFAVTLMEGEGKAGKREILLLHLKRKSIPAAMAMIKGRLDNAVITVNDIRTINGGFIKK